MPSRRQFLGTLSGLLFLGRAAQAWPKLDIGFEPTKVQPSSSLTGELIEPSLDRLVKFNRIGGIVLSRYELKYSVVSCTGSMRPAIGDGDVVLLEYAPYDEVDLGDIVMWRDPIKTERTAEGIVPLSRLHRIWGGHAGAWVVRGDNLESADPYILTVARYVARVRAVFYSKKPEAAAELSLRTTQRKIP